MVKFRFFDKDESRIRKFGASDDLPDEVAGISIHGPFDSNKRNYRVLTTMLKSSSKKLEHIKIKYLSEESPEFLAFLVLICSMTNSLQISDCPLSTNAASCVMAALLARDGIRHFSFSLDFEGHVLTSYEAKILLEGVASSPCLESFDFKAFEMMIAEDVGRYLVQALRRNQNLKKISIHTAGFDDKDTQNIVNASILGPNMKYIHIEDFDEQVLQLDELQDALCRKDCTVEKLHLECFKFATGDDSLDFWDGSVMQNVSVKSLTFYGVTSDSVELSEIISLFKSLEELNLSRNDITKLSFLDSLLFTDKRSKLKSLDLGLNRCIIDEEEIKKFIRFLSINRGLKHLRIDEDGWDSDSWKTALIDALLHNTDLEHVDFGRKDLHHSLHLNRGGRRVFESSQAFPTNLLPLVLERASKISYYKRWDRFGRPTNKEPRADVVFWMVQRMAPQL